MSVTILTTDVLLVDERLSRAILRRTGLLHSQIYFTATHTHGGPGGWGIHPLERLVAGTYDPDEFDRLADRLAEAVSRSRDSLVEAEVAFVQVDASGMQHNRIHPGRPTDESLSAWVFRPTVPLPGRSGPAPALATLTTFAAHATVAHPFPPRLGADYPGAFSAELTRQADVGEVLFAAGAVGDAGPNRVEAANEQAKAEAYGRNLARLLVLPLARAKFRSEVELANLRVAVDLPSVQIPFGTARLQFSPLATWWVGQTRTYLHAVRLGSAILIGFPGDYAGELATKLSGDGAVVATSFNGDYKGYLVSTVTFQTKGCYETRWMSFYGPGLGDHLTRVAQSCLGNLGRDAR